MGDMEAQSMKPPLKRMHASSETRHHLLFEKPEWTARHKAKRVRELGAYVVGVKRAPHDYLHAAVQPVPVPNNQVLDAMFEIGREYVGWQNDQNRIESMMDCFAGYAKGTKSPHQAHDMLSIMTSLDAQMSIIGMFKDLRPRYE